MILRLNSLACDCVIGERADERTRCQRLMVDVALELADAVADTDELADTVDYAALADRIRATLREGAFKMIERAAKAVCETCLADRRVLSARALVTKSGAVAGLGSASVEFMMSSVAFLPIDVNQKN